MTKEPLPIRRAATVVLLRDTARGPEVFLLRRVAELDFAAGMAVFPGGAVDVGDSAALTSWRGPAPAEVAAVLGVAAAQDLVVAAVRELIEETGVTLVSQPGDLVRPGVLAAGVRSELEAGAVSLPDALNSAGLEVRADLLRPWSRWITPTGMSRRYDTAFFLARLPAGQIPDDATSEAVDSGWWTPKAALAAADTGQIRLMRPTAAVLTGLAGFARVADIMVAPSPHLDAPGWPVMRGQTTYQVRGQPVRLRRHTALASSRLAPNPGPMTLDGTNSYVLAGPDSRTRVVVDPGPLDVEHLAELAAEPVELVLITHHHLDHTEASAAFHALTGAPVRALDPGYCLAAEPLADGEVIEAAGLRIEVIASPGHTADSVCFRLPQDVADPEPSPHADLAAVSVSQPGPGPGAVASLVSGSEPRTGAGASIGCAAAGAVLTGDTILGQGTTIIAHPDGRLADYLASLDRLGRLGPATVLPAHGPVLPDLAVAARRYADHRQQRLDQIRAALTRHQVSADGASVERVTDWVYADIDPSVRGAAERSVAAQLSYLREHSSSTE